MIYAHFMVHDAGIVYDHKVVAETMEAYDAHKRYLMDELDCTISQEFIDSDFGTIVVLPEDFEY